MLRTRVRRHHPFSSAYAAAFRHLPSGDTSALRSAAVDYVDTFVPSTWHTSPIRTILHGALFDATGDPEPTTDAFGKVNGMQILSTPTHVDTVIGHARQCCLTTEIILISTRL